ncbi:hypothetical protein COU77_01715 [Candidatus Peregrinibacteria bacterium CG10_big_fil_rev_8_21_14_0_10_49_16]|nr:MAG: hypothetical protein COW95_01610 [Candidatus Peregrinibacteria bacterium CG22_combo_CG10-13_8_21_14_all_49_11]PIR52216.1 MAG: hypothetical protein COU77_01715 [Candidatus Peregrinibacteria bacterium CG10_big_fil_rev_8_21_14_0_10_49_16]
MSSLFAGVARKHADLLYFLFRVLTGFMFMSHGLQKLGMLNGTFKVEGFIGVVGVCELIGGLAILLGIWTRLAALLGAILLLGAYIKVHAAGGLLPIMNKGELALLYVAVFAILFVHGSGKWGVEKDVLKREQF